MELWEVENTYKILRSIRPTKEDACRIENNTVAEFVEDVLVGSAIYSPDYDSYLDYSEFRKGVIKWNRVND